ncbi:MAG TPA: primosomal protein N' [Gammaproteobacteria bacterium]|nr:primosomal protein N' [Gammaproteobacteria bacterium]
MQDSPRIVRVAVPKPLRQLFDYQLEPDQPGVVPGARLRVPFGRQSLVAVCVSADPPDPHPEPRQVLEALDAENIFGDALFRLALWVADYYHHPLGEVLDTLLPARLRQGASLDAETGTRAGFSLTPRGAGQDASSVLNRAPRQRALLAFLEQLGGSSDPETLRAAGFDAALVRAVAAKGLIVRTLEALPRARLMPERRPRLNPEQAAVLDALDRAGDGYGVTLLEGVTGSGKTEVYLRAMERVLAEGRQVLVLVPEIALTPQTLRRFEERFGTAATLHSGLTDVQRLAVWSGCRAGTVDILIGTRSAVLTPFRQLGLIIVDEEHDGSFKQQEGLRYSARDVAVKRARDLGIPLLLGSATPSLETLHNARTGRYRHLVLTYRAGGAEAPTCHLIDIRGQSLEDGLSPTLIAAVRRQLAVGGQVLLFLNRRGYAPSYVCTACGWQARCSECELPMTLHRDPEALICHRCSVRAPLPRHCPACQRSALLGIGLGTQRAEDGLTKLFPNVPIYRIDRDTARSRQRLEASFAAILRGEPALLVGTQMLAKGHHFPGVTLVGVLNADSGFLSPDFRAPERTAQLIVQVAGRAGRAERPGEVWVQTYQPDNPALLALLKEGYPAFAERELALRQAAGFPPWRAMVLVRAEGNDAESVRGALLALRVRLEARMIELGAGSGVEVLGPVPAPLPKIGTRYRLQLLLLADTRRQLQRLLQGLDPGAGQRGTQVTLDIDPYDGA